jgi:hypothetical protein
MALLVRPRIRRLPFFARLRRRVQQLKPYPSLLVLLVPLTLVEPLKMAALLVAGKGHWLSGTAMIVVAYGASLLIVERLFRIVKPKLLMLHWFATTWAIVQRIRGAVISALCSARGRL